MPDTPSRTGSRTTHDTDLIIVGGGPAGCAAARMAAGVGMRSVLIERDALCRNLYRIPALNNVLGGHTSGPGLADSITAELNGTEPCHLELGRHAVELRADDDQVAVTLDTGTRLTAPYAVVATGVGPLQPRDVPWITTPGNPTLPRSGRRTRTMPKAVPSSSSAATARSAPSCAPTRPPTPGCSSPTPRPTRTRPRRSVTTPASRSCPSRT